METDTLTRMAGIIVGLSTCAYVCCYAVDRQQLHPARHLQGMFQIDVSQHACAVVSFITCADGCFVPHRMLRRQLQARKTRRLNSKCLHAPSCSRRWLRRRLVLLRRPLRLPMDTLLPTGLPRRSPMRRRNLAQNPKVSCRALRACRRFAIISQSHRVAYTSCGQAVITDQHSRSRCSCAQIRGAREG